MTFCVYVISGLCVGVAALIFTSRLMAAQAISGQGFELQAIAAAVIGGASLFGGRGKISNTIVGALIMGVLFNGFVMLDVSQPIQQMSVGIIIIVSVWLDGVLRNRRRRMKDSRAVSRLKRRRDIRFVSEEGGCENEKRFISTDSSSAASVSRHGAAAPARRRR